MNSKVENALRKGMTVLGHAVESVIGRAKKARVSIAAEHSVQPILALESQLSMSKIKELIEFSVDRIVKPLVPNLVDKSSLELNEGQMVFCPSMKEKGSAISVHVDIGGSAGNYPGELGAKGLFNIRASLNSIPFEDGFFDFVVANLATARQGDIIKAAKEIGRLTTLGGQAIIIDFHPFGRFAKRGSVRLRSMESVVRGMEDYYKICKAAGFNVSYIKEAFIDEMVRAIFVTTEEKSSFRQLKDTPFLVFLLVNKRGG